MAQFNGALGQHGHSVHVEGRQVVLVGKDGQLGAGQHSAVAALLHQVLGKGGKLLRVPRLARFDVVIDERHDLLLSGGPGCGGVDAEGGKFPLVQTGADGAVGGQDAGALFPWLTSSRAVSRIMWTMGMEICSCTRSRK